MAVFPDICPTGREYTAARWPVRSIESLGGVTSRRLFGDRPSAAQLTLTFDNLSDDRAAEIEQNHRDSLGELDRVTFPARIWSGQSSSLAARTQAPGAGLSWHWSEPPQISSVVPGRSTVRCSFAATQDA